MVRPAHNGRPPRQGALSASPSPTFEGVPRSPRHLLLLRHGQSEWNADGRWQGQADPPLSELGEEQARDAAERLRATTFSSVVASDLRRARTTAEILAEALGLPLEIDQGLREIDVGSWTGLTRSEIRARWPGELAAWSEGHRESPLGGETRTHLVARARASLARAAGRAPSGARVLVVTHGALIRNLDRALGLSPADIGNLSGRWYEAGGDGFLVPGEVVSLADPEERTLSPNP
jgi:broad specificity phosphatase PhoE